jgi:hypothetical protein
VFKSFTLNSRLASTGALEAFINGEPARPQPGPPTRDETDVGPLVLDVMTYPAG